MTDQSCDTAACEGKKGATPPACQAATANDGTSPSGAICPAAAEPTSFQTSSLLPHRGPAPRHIVADNKAAKECGNGDQHFPESTFAPRDQAGHLGLQHLCQIRHQNPQSGRGVWSVSPREGGLSLLTADGGGI